MRRNNSDVTVIIPTLNEELGIGPSIRELMEVLGDPYLLVVDGNSVDDTVKIAKELGAEVILQEGKGKGLAVAQAMKHTDSDPRCIVFIDADYTYPARNLPEMIKVLEENPSVGMIIGNRFNSGFDFRRATNDMLYLGNRCLAFAQHLLNGVKLCDPLSGLRVVRWDLLKDWRPKSKCFDIEAELNHHVEKSGYSIVEIPIQYRQRLGEKKLKLKHGVTILKRILAESMY